MTSEFIKQKIFLSILAIIGDFSKIRLETKKLFRKNVIIDLFSKYLVFWRYLYSFGDFVRHRRISIFLKNMRVYINYLLIDIISFSLSHYFWDYKCRTN